jgi:hypothetical protein
MRVLGAFRGDMRQESYYHAFRPATAHLAQVVLLRTNVSLVLRQIRVSHDASWMTAQLKARYRSLGQAPPCEAAGNAH